MPIRFDEPQFVKNAKEWWMSRALPPHVLELGSTKNDIIKAAGGGSGTKMPEEERKRREKEYKKKRNKAMGQNWKGEYHNLSYLERDRTVTQLFRTVKDQITGMKLPNGWINMPNIRFDIGRSLGLEDISLWFKYRGFKVTADDIAYFIKTGDSSGIVLRLLP